MSEAFARQGREILSEDLPAARALLTATLGGNALLDIALHALARAADGKNPEYRGLVAPHSGPLAALALFGHVAGTIGAARLFAIVWRDDAARLAASLLEDVSLAARREGARLLLAELPDDPAFSPMAQLLLAHGYVEEARIPDFVRDGVALRFLRLSVDS